MAWVGARTKEWLPKKPQAKKIPPLSVAVPPPLPAPIVVPDFPAFSPAAVAHALGRSRSAVGYWMNNHKLEFYRYNLGERYVLRAELVRFVREYLQQSVAE